ncbi:MAG: flagellar hook-associated protein FlgL [Deltaproteobacteria bacterium]|nr:flagellar hook-associated protein FlgL [Deltaproteobacteria bacterium]
MRVTQNITTNNYISYIHKQTANLLKTQQQIATQKRINKISDDPIGMGHVLGYRTDLAAIRQYEKNITQGITRIEFDELTLDMAADLVSTARQLGGEYSNPNFSAAERQLVADQIKELYDQVMQLANSKFNGNYIFSGHATDTAPFSRDAAFNVTYNGDDGRVRIVVAENVEVSVDADGRNIFQNAANGGVNIFDELKNLIDGLENPDPVAGSAQIKATITPLYNGRQQINTKRSEYAPVLYRLQATEEYLLNLRPKVEGAMASTEDADITKAIIELKNLELAYETTLASAARIIQPTLLDVLR